MRLVRSVGGIVGVFVLAGCGQATPDGPVADARSDQLVSGTLHRIAQLTPDGSHVGDSSALFDNGGGTIGVDTTTPVPGFALDIDRTSVHQNGIRLHTHVTSSPDETPQIVFSDDQGPGGSSHVSAMFNSVGQYYTAGFMVISGDFRATLDETTGAYAVTNLGFPTAEPSMLVVRGDVGGPVIIDKGSNDAGSYLFEGIDGNGNTTFKLENDGTIKWGASALAAVDTTLHRIGASSLKTDGAFTAGGAGAFGGDVDLTTHQIHNVVDPTSAQDAATKGYVDAKLAGGAPASITGGTCASATCDLAWGRVTATADTVTIGFADRGDAPACIVQVEGRGGGAIAPDMFPAKNQLTISHPALRARTLSYHCGGELRSDSRGRADQPI